MEYFRLLIIGMIAVVAVNYGMTCFGDACVEGETFQQIGTPQARILYANGTINATALTSLVVLNQSLGVSPSSTSWIQGAIDPMVQAFNWMTSGFIAIVETVLQPFGFPSILIEIVSMIAGLAAALMAAGYVRGVIIQ